jgi:hypothetical protein
MIPRGEIVEEFGDWLIGPPVIIAPNETKSIKLDLPTGIAHNSDEAVFRLYLGDRVISLTDLRSFQK